MKSSNPIFDRVFNPEFYKHKHMQRKWNILAFNSLSLQWYKDRLVLAHAPRLVTRLYCLTDEPVRGKRSMLKTASLTGIFQEYKNLTWLEFNPGGAHK